MAGRFSSSSKRSDGPFSGMGCIGDLVGVVSATAGAGVGAGATGGAGFQLDLLAKCSTLRSSVRADISLYPVSSYLSKWIKPGAK